MSVLVRLARQMAPFRWWMVFSVVVSFATLGANIALMATAAYLISQAALATSVADLSVAIAAVELFAVSRVALRYVERSVIHSTTFRILTKLRVWLYTALEPLAPACLLRRRSGDVLARLLADIDTLEYFYARAVVPPVAAALATALAALILGAFDIWLGIALLCFLLLTGVALPLITMWLSRVPATLMVTTRAELTAALVDETQGTADLLAYDGETRHLAQIAALSQRLNQAQERLAMIRGLGLALGALMASLAGITVLLLAIPLVSGGRVDGVYLALVPLTAIASFEAVQPLTLALQSLESSKAAASRIFELIDAKPAVEDRPLPELRPKDYSLEARGLRFAYAPDEPPVLDDVSFSVPSGGRLVIVGPSGIGKTTLVNLLLRFWEYQEGSIRLGGHELRDYQADDVRSMIGVVAQDPYLFSGTVRDNLLLANADADDEQIVSACRQAQLDEFVQSLPNGYDTWVGENGLLLSGGERQRLAVARCILKDAPMLILDEATVHLDAVTEAALLDALRRFAVGRTTVIISHRMQRREPADHVLMLGEAHTPEQPSASKSA